MTESVYNKNCLSCDGKNLEYFGNFYMNCYQTNAKGCEPMVNLIRCRDCNFASVVMITKKEVDDHVKAGKNSHIDIIQSVSDNKSDNKPIKPYHPFYC